MKGGLNKVNAQAFDGGEKPLQDYFYPHWLKAKQKSARTPSELVKKKGGTQPMMGGDKELPPDDKRSREDSAEWPKLHFISESLKNFVNSLGNMNTANFKPAHLPRIVSEVPCSKQDATQHEHLMIRSSKGRLKGYFKRLIHEKDSLHPLQLNSERGQEHALDFDQTR